MPRTCPRSGHEVEIDRVRTASRRCQSGSSCAAASSSGTSTASPPPRSAYRSTSMRKSTRRLALQSSEARLDGRVTGMGLWELDFRTEQTRWFSDWCVRLDIDPCDGTDHVARWDANLHPEDVGTRRGVSPITWLARKTITTPNTACARARASGAGSSSAVASSSARRMATLCAWSACASTSTRARRPRFLRPRASGGSRWRSKARAAACGTWTSARDACANELFLPDARCGARRRRRRRQRVALAHPPGRRGARAGCRGRGARRTHRSLRGGIPSATLRRQLALGARPRSRGRARCRRQDDTARRLHGGDHRPRADAGSAAQKRVPLPQGRAALARIHVRVSLLENGNAEPSG